MQHTSRQFDSELDGIRASVLAMGALAVEQLQRVLAALNTTAFALSDEIAGTERAINVAQSEIDALCARVVAKRQPAASDLRAILSTIHIISDIERIGDEAKKVLASLGNEELNVIARRVPELASMTVLISDMLQRALSSLDKQDVLNALDVLRLDTKVDADYAAAIDRVTRMFPESPSLASRLVECTFVARSLERCGDHAKNVAEAVISMVRGDDVRHQLR